MWDLGWKYANEILQAEEKMEIIQRKEKLYRPAMQKDKKYAKVGAQSQWNESAVWYVGIKDGISSVLQV